MKILKCLILLSLLLVSCNSVVFKYKYGDIIYKKDISDKRILEELEFYKCNDHLFIYGYRFDISWTFTAYAIYEFHVLCLDGDHWLHSELK